MCFVQWNGGDNITPLLGVRMGSIGVGGRGQKLWVGTKGRRHNPGHNKALGGENLPKCHSDKTMGSPPWICHLEYMEGEK